MTSERSIPPPGSRAKHVEASLLHTISLAAMVLAVARIRRMRSRLETELEWADNEIAFLK